MFLMRHGHVDYFAPGVTDPRMVPLTDLGRAQAEAARDALAQTTFDIVVHSGLPRTISTSEIVAAPHNAPNKGVKTIAEPDLEELKSGWLQAESREELAARLAYCFDDAATPGARFLPDGETFADAEMRIVRGLTRLVNDHSWRCALVVAHEGVNRIALGWACRGGLSTISAFEQDLACVNVIDLDVTPKPAPSDSGSSAETTTGAAPELQIERAIIKTANVTPYDYVKHGLPRTSLEHLFEVDFGGARPSL